MEQSNNTNRTVLNALAYFPVTETIREPNSSQRIVIEEAVKAFSEGHRIVIVEGPVGCGKTAIATTLARFYREGHILTPRKSLQDQYFDDFNKYMVLMKGRSAYPCVRWDRSNLGQIYEDIRKGQIIPPANRAESCAKGICLSSAKQKEVCLNLIPVCPYVEAIKVASQNNIICHNLHSFIFQVNFGGYFDKRPFLAVDEAHDAAGILRDFATKTIFLKPHTKHDDAPADDDHINLWISWLLQDKFLPFKEEDREEYVSMVESLQGKEYVVEMKEDDFGRMYVKFVPKTIFGLAESLMFQYGEKILLMSGTIFGKEVFCRNLGIKPEDAYYIRLPSTFPVKNRPVYVKEEYLVDTSHKNWEANLGTLAENINKVCKVFNDKKGLIHVPSYRAAEEVLRACNNPRLISHTSVGFQKTLEEFYASEGNGVLVSPVCQQGVDFKGDRARFQIVTRVPYLNTSDAFVNFKVTNEFSWYNYQALVVFGQMLGRVNRGANDFGVTVLMDERFVKFIRKNKNLIPKWQYEAFIWN